MSLSFSNSRENLNNSRGAPAAGLVLRVKCALFSVQCLCPRAPGTLSFSRQHSELKSNWCARRGGILKSAPWGHVSFLVVLRAVNQVKMMCSSTRKSSAQRPDLFFEFMSLRILCLQYPRDCQQSPQPPPYFQIAKVINTSETGE